MWKALLLAALGLSVVIAIALAYGSSRWQAATRAIHAGLPVPVQRYFRITKIEYEFAS